MYGLTPKTGFSGIITVIQGLPSSFSLQTAFNVSRLGLWLLFLPLFLLSAFVAITLIVSHTRRSDFIFFWIFVGLGYLSFIVLYRSTRNYFRAGER